MDYQLTDEDLELGIAFRTATCHTTGCVGDGQPITGPFAAVIVCGGCVQEITDIVLLSEQEPSPQTPPAE